MLETFTVDTFHDLLNDEFLLDTDDGTVTLRLIEATSVGGAPPGGTRLPFSILFSGPPEPLLAQRIYPFDHRTLGRFELFLVPVAAEGGGVTYQAVFG